jgi:ketoreductase RED1
VIPLVEVVPGEHTEAGAVSRAVAFYKAVGKHPVVVSKEIPGFVANRLQAALFRECIYLVTQGVVDVAELDEIVTNSIGLRWAAQGPFLSFDLGGGSDGLRQFFNHLGPDLEAIWKVLGSPLLDDATVGLLTEQAETSFGTLAEAELESERDRRQLAILDALASAHMNGA